LDIDWHYKLLFLLILFFLSAFFSGSEVALFSLDKRKLKDSFSKYPLIERYIFQLLDYPRRLLVTILVGNTIVNVAASIVAVSLAIDYADYSKLSLNLVLTVQIILLTILIVIFGDLIPKVWATKKPLSFAKVISIPLFWISVIFYPVSETLTEIIKMMVSKIKFDKTKSAMSPEEISELADLSHERGAIIEEEHGLINGIVGFRKVLVHEVMTPRVDMVCVSIDSDFETILKIVTSSGHSRIPLYENNLDKIIGIIYAKDILPFLMNETLRKNLSLAKIARKVLFIPETKKIDDLMREFQEKKMHQAIVVDEYGGTSGLITLEDIMEEIIGEIRDEYDKEETQVTKLTENSYLVLGKISVDDVNELLNAKLPVSEGEFETLGGLVLNYAGHIPKEGYSFQLENYKFTVKEVSNKRIKKVLIESLSSE